MYTCPHILLLWVLITKKHFILNENSILVLRLLQEKYQNLCPNRFLTGWICWNSLLYGVIMIQKRFKIPTDFLKMTKNSASRRFRKWSGYHFVKLVSDAKLNLRSPLSPSVYARLPATALTWCPRHQGVRPSALSPPQAWKKQNTDESDRQTSGPQSVRALVGETVSTKQTHTEFYVLSFCYNKSKIRWWACFIAQKVREDLPLREGDT